MILTREQEEELIQKHQGLIKRYALSFSGRHTNGGKLAEDFIQDASIAFLRRIRTAETEEEATNFYHDAIHEMCLDVLSYQVLSAPKRTGAIRQVLNSMPKCVPAEHDTAGYTMDGIEDQIDRKTFIKSLPAEHRQIIYYLSEGLTRQETAEELRMSYDNLRYRLEKIRKKYFNTVYSNDIMKYG